MDLHAIQSGQDKNVAARAARVGLSLLSPGYRVANAARMAMFDAGLRKPKPLGRPAVSVGNLTAGGSGKTPTTVALCQHLLMRSARPCVLSRGYGGDEADEMRSLLGDGVRVCTDPDRAAIAAKALELDPGIDVFVLDDGFQHRQAARDLDLVLIDALQPWGHGRLLPRGLLREPIGALRRADAVVLTRCDRADEPALQAIERRVDETAAGLPTARTAFDWLDLLDHEDRPRPTTDLADLAVFGVCGLGNPRGFFGQLESAAQRLVGSQALPDHHAYAHGEPLAHAQRAQAAGAQAVVTTGKDWVKWRRDVPPGGWPIPVLRPRLGLRWIAGGDAVLGKFDALISNAASASAMSPESSLEPRPGASPA
ncbi:MAG: tetraacyldisaccharide 4'-kinase [Planctomycetota bacterium]